MSVEIGRKEETFTLSKDIANPKPDRRHKRDWRYAPVWEKGTKFIVTTETHERTGLKVKLKAAKSIAYRFAKLAEAVPVEVAREIRTLESMDLNPFDYVYVQKRGGYDRIGERDERFAGLMKALKPAERDLKDVLGWCKEQPDLVLQRLVDRGAITLSQIETVIAELWEELPE